MTRDHVDRIQAQWRTERPELDPAPQGVIGRLHRLAGHLHEELLPVYRAHGLGEGDFDVLASLRRAGAPYELPAGELAEHTMITTGGMTKRLDRLEHAGLVARRVDPDDARVRRVRLTERGRTAIDAAYGDHMRNEARLLAELPASDRAELERILRDWLLRVEGPVD